MTDGSEIQALLNLHPYEQVIDFSEDQTSGRPLRLVTFQTSSFPHDVNGEEVDHESSSSRPRKAPPSAANLQHQFRVRTESRGKHARRLSESVSANARDIRAGLRQFKLTTRRQDKSRSMGSLTIAPTSLPQSRASKPLFGEILTGSGGLQNKIDPFTVLPSFMNPNLAHTESMLYQFSYRYGHLHASRLWQDAMLSDRVACLSFLNICVMAAHPGRMSGPLGIETLCARFETIRLLNDQLCRRATQTSNSTMMSLNHMLVSELCTADRETIEMHVRGSERVMKLRGGFEVLHAVGPLERECAARNQYSILVACVMNDLRPDPAVLSYQPSGMPNLHDGMSNGLMESPVYHDDDQPLVPDSAKDLPEKLLWILFGLRTLTELLLQELDSVDPVKDTSQRVNRFKHEEMNAVYEDLLSQPTASDLDMKAIDATMYEAIRLTGIIYSSAIMHGIPFSHATKLTVIKTREPEIIRRVMDLFTVLADTPAFEKYLGCALWATLVSAAAIGPTAFVASACVDQHSGAFKPLPMKFFEAFYSTQHARVVCSMKTISRIQAVLSAGNHASMSS